MLSMHNTVNDDCIVFNFKQNALVADAKPILGCEVCEPLYVSGESVL